MFYLPLVFQKLLLLLLPFEDFPLLGQLGTLVQLKVLLRLLVDLLLLFLVFSLFFLRSQALFESLLLLSSSEIFLLFVQQSMLKQLMALQALLRLEGVTDGIEKSDKP